jgi:hypothetical protein
MIFSFFDIFKVLQFECFSCSTFFSFLAISRFLQCVFLIFHFFSVSHHIPGPTRCFSHLSSLSVFLPYSSSYSVHFSLFTFFSAFRHIPGHTVFLSHFPHFSVFSPKSMPYIVYFSYFMFSVFLAMFHVLPYEFLIFLICQFSRHIPGSRVCVSHFPLFQCFSPHSTSYALSF